MRFSFLGERRENKTNRFSSQSNISLVRKNLKNARQACLIALFTCSFLISVWILPAVSANRIAFSYGIYGEFYISVADLEVFAKEGKITRSFAYYADRFTPENLTKFRALLNQSFDVDVVTASTFLHLPVGEELTKELALAIDSPKKVSLPALRASVILAAAEPKGLTVLNVLRLYSTKTLKLDTDRIEQAVNEATKILADTERVFKALDREKVAVIENSIDVGNIENLSNSGAKKWRKEQLILEPLDGESSIRKVEGVVYLPLANGKPAPLVVVAPGLNTDWQNFSYIAEHLASYGFGVAALNFPSTDAERVDAVLNGLGSPPPDNQWLEQPKVVTRLLDEIERRTNNDSQWQGKLNLQKVGIIGQSLGGYTAMAIAGAKVDWQHLQQKCQTIRSPEKINLKPSLYWQCQGAADSIPNINLQDKRIAAAIAINPVTNPVFSKSATSQLKTPLMMIAGDKDLFAPALDEQIEPFSWLSEIDKYLVLVKNGTHFSFIGGEDNSKLPWQSSNDDPALARSYLKILSVAFFKTHLNRQEEFSSYLTKQLVLPFKIYLKTFYLVF